MQKLTKLLLIISLFTSYTYAQTGELSTFTINDTKITVNSNGSLFWDGQDGQFISPFEEGEPEISTMRGAGLWMAGVDSLGNLKGGIQLYNEDNKADFQAGILEPDSGQPAGLLTSVYKVTSADIEAHLADIEDNGIVDNPNAAVFGWPARGNAFFSDYHDGELLPNTSQGLAPFWDEDQDAIYNPMAGDLPVLGIRGCMSTPVYADEMAWFVYNDVLPHTESATESISMEIQVLVFGYECEELPFKNTIYTRHKLINYGDEDLFNFSTGIFADFEIGNGSDDFVGTDTLRNLIFGYNGDELDEDGFGSNAPAMTIDVLRGVLDENRDETALTYVLPFTENAFSQPSEFQNLLTGINTDGSAGPANGFAFPGNPNEPTETSEVTAGNTPGDRKVLMSFPPVILEPGAVNEVIMAHTAYQGEDASVTENIDLMYEKADRVQALFDNCFDVTTITDICPSQIVPVTEVPIAKLEIYPNPTTDLLTIKPEVYLDNIRLVSMDGRLIFNRTISNRSLGQTINLSDLPAGIYFLECQAKNGQAVARKKLVKISN